MSDEMTTTNDDILGLTAEITAAFVGNNTIASGDIAGLIQSVFSSLQQAGSPAPAPAGKREPAVSIRSSVKDDYIVCLEDGAKLKMLKRYLRTKYDMSPEDYRAKWGLPRDYPMVAPSYAATRKELALKIGLGRKKVDTARAATAKEKAVAHLNPTPATPKKAGRPKKTPVEA